MRKIATTMLTGLIVLCSGCSMGLNPGWKPGGNLASNDHYTYVSTSHTPQTVSIVDTRSGEVIWSRDVPVAKQLNIRFVRNTNKDNPSRPDTMKYAVTDAGKLFGRLTDEITVPPAESRRIDVELRKGPEFPR